MNELDIVGGVYHEVVVIPEHVELLGSAGRAAVAIGPERASITLHTVLAVKDGAELARLAKSNGFQTKVAVGAETIAFSYVHGLDPPRIFPPTHYVRPLPVVEVAASRVLCFGAIDFDWHVTADQVVYDPQDAFRARPFSARGSAAKRLALVLNEYEAKQITGAETTAAMLAELFHLDAPEVVVLKCGAKGTIVATSPTDTAIVPPLITPNVFKLGSGDVFSAFFAWAWMVEGLAPQRSAELAAQATAYYVSTRTLPIPKDFEAANAEYGIHYASLPARTNRNVYLAAPFFTLAQRWLVEEARLYLREMGLQVFSPFHDIGYGPADKVARADLDAIYDCDIVYAIVSGLDPGTLFEIGYARAAGKPVVVYVENERSEDLKMLDGSGCSLSNDFASSIYNVLWAARFSA